MRNSVEAATLAGVVASVSIRPDGKAVLYNTQDTHNFKPGQSVTITGLTGNTAANLTGALIGSITATGFTAYVPDVISSTTGQFVSTTISTTAPTVTSTATAWVTNSWANQNRVRYGTPAPVKALPYYLDTTPSLNLSAITYNSSGNGIVTVNWSSIGSSNPTVSFTLTQVSVFGTVTLTSGATTSVGSTTVSNLVANNQYTYTITASNAVGSKEVSESVRPDPTISSMGPVTATAKSGVSGTIRITWEAPAVAAPSLTYYYIQRATSTDNINFGSWSDLTNVSGTTLTYDDTTATIVGTYYKYQVRAYNGIVYNPYNQSAPTTANFLTTPVALPSYVSTSTVDISVASDSYSSNPPVTSWKVERSLTGVGSWSVLTASTPSLPYVNSSVSQNTTYYYRITADNGEVVATSASSIGIKTYSVPNAPTGVYSLAGASSVTVYWTAATVTNAATPVVNYTIERSSDNATWTTVTTAVSGNATSYTDTSVNSSASYYYRVTAVNGIGSSTASTGVQDYYVATVTPTVSPIASTANQLSVTWSAPSSNPALSSYTLLRATSTDNINWSSWSAPLSLSSPTATSYTETTALSSTYYKYQLTANNAQVSSIPAVSNVTQPYYISSPMSTPNVTRNTTDKNPTIQPVNYVSNPAVTTWTIERSLNGTSGWSTVISTNALPVIDTSVSSGTTYYYRLTGASSQLTSAASVASYAVTTNSVPSAPSVSGIATTSNTVINWTSSTVVNPDTPVINYGIDRSTNGSVWTTITTALSSSATSYTDTVGTSNSVYYYRVYATNSLGTSPYSTSTLPSYINTTTPTATPTASTANSITVTWSEPTSNPSLTNYTLQRSNSTDNATWGSWSTIGTPTSTSYVDTAVSNSTYYRYQIRANNAQLFSAYVVSNSTQPYYVTSPMNSPVLTNSSISTTSVNIAVPIYISNPSVSTWTIERGTTNGTWTYTTTSSTLPVTDTTVSAGTSYYYRLTANNGQLTSSPSTSASITTYAVPTAPTPLSATAVSYNTINLSWTASTTNSVDNPVIDYKVERATNGGFTTGLTVVSSTVTGVTYTDTTASQTTTYYYRVSARNGLGYSAVSSIWSATTPVQPIYTSIDTVSFTNMVTYPTTITMSGTITPVPTGGTVGISFTSSSPTYASVNTSTGAWSVPNIGYPGQNNPYTITYSGYNAYQPSTYTGVYTIYQGQPVVTQNLVDGSNVTSYAFNIGSTMYYKANLALPMSNTPLSGETVRFEAYNSTSATWEVIGSATTDVNGAIQIPWTPASTAYTYIRGIFDGSQYYLSNTTSSYSINIRDKYTVTFNSNGAGSVGTLTGTAGQEAASTFTVPNISGAVDYKIDSMTLNIAGSGVTATVKPSIWTTATSGTNWIYQGGSRTVASNASPTTQTFTSVNASVTAGTTYYVGFWKSTAAMLYSYGTISGPTTVYDDSATAIGTLNHDRTVSNRAINYSVTYSYYK